MAKFTSFLIIALLVCSITTLISASRTMPFSNYKDMKTENVKVGDNDIESCQGVNEEDCLIRRTLVAHTDYIYTQHQNP
ncbi:Phytosulfokines 3 [Bienertia sinuspersici]